MTKVQDYSSYTYGIDAWGWFDDEDLIFGSAFDDILRGARGDDVIYGGDGDDTVSDLTTNIYYVGPASLFGDYSHVEKLRRRAASTWHTGSRTFMRTILMATG